MDKGIEGLGLVKRFPGVEAVRGVDVVVYPGEVVGLLGPNGAGKTTTLRMLAGLIQPSEGVVRIAGFDVASQAAEARARLGFLSSGTGLYRRLSVREVLAYFGRLHGHDEAFIASRIAQLAEELELWPFLDRRCEVLSSGQRQRANIARAFLHDPPVVILDEPTASLDVLSGHFILQAISAARAAGRAVLFSTHIMSEAEVLCDRILLLHEGRVLYQGALEAILAQAQQPNLTYAFLKLAGRNPEAEGAS
ncbi:ATP-binding cassette domain-containing protein [Myxococcota bacterium]|nr:ATP-binding cassette domain-containing protein [Myxococcota bacterium]MBU1429862.1 ATP-binding cassette domain-containing protein [Myxococcota bacterium]MBU1896460.1 ATP-binding cassette domain-containing protein [Myxococcota bacterium]